MSTIPSFRVSQSEGLMLLMGESQVRWVSSTIINWGFSSSSCILELTWELVKAINLQILRKRKRKCKYGENFLLFLLRTETSLEYRFPVSIPKSQQAYSPIRLAERNESQVLQHVERIVNCFNYCWINCRFLSVLIGFISLSGMEKERKNNGKVFVELQFCFSLSPRLDCHRLLVLSLFLSLWAFSRTLLFPIGSVLLSLLVSIQRIRLDTWYHLAILICPTSHLIQSHQQQKLKCSLSNKQKSDCYDRGLKIPDILWHQNGRWLHQKLSTEWESSIRQCWGN